MLRQHERKRIDEIKQRLDALPPHWGIDARWLLAIVESQEQHIDSLEEAIADTESELEALAAENKSLRADLRAHDIYG